MSNKEVASAVLAHPEARTTRSDQVAEISVARSAQESPDLVECFRHEGEECPRCDGSGYRPRKCWASCDAPSGRPGEGGKALMGLRNRRGWDQRFYCLGCHPELGPELTMLKKG